MLAIRSGQAKRARDAADVLLGQNRHIGVTIARVPRCVLERVLDPRECSIRDQNSSTRGGGGELGAIGPALAGLDLPPCFLARLTFQHVRVDNR